MKYARRNILAISAVFAVLMLSSCVMVISDDGDHEADAATTLTLRFNANGGTGAPSAVTVSSNYSVDWLTIPDTEPTRNGYLFQGWAPNSDDMYPMYWPGDQVPVGSTYGNTVTLYAIWAYEYTLVFNANGGSGAPGSLSYAADTQSNYGYFEIPETEPTRSGHTFIGWSDSPSGDVIFTPGDSMSVTGPDSSTTFTLYAIWALGTTDGTATFGLDVSGNDGTEYARFNSRDAFEVTLTISYSGDKVTAATFRVTKIASASGYYNYGYTYGQSTFRDGGYAAITSSTLANDSEWPVGTTRTFNALAGTGIDAQYVAYVDFEFYWGFTSSYVSGVPSWSSSNTPATWTVSLDQVISWNFTTTVSYDLNGGSGSISDTVRTTISDLMNPGNITMTISNTTPTHPDGLQFAGWATSENGDAVYRAGQQIPVACGDSLTLYAVWSQPSHNVTFMLNGEVYQTTTVAVGDTVPVPEQPQVYGYTFKGWFWDDGTFANEFQFATEIIDSDITLYAKMEGDLVFTTDPIADGTVTAVNGSPGTVLFNATASQYVTSLEWDFGDGSPTSSATYVTHYYSQPGTYTATLTVYNDYGDSTMEFTIEVPEDGAMGDGTDNLLIWIAMVLVVVIAGGLVVSRFLL